MKKREELALRPLDVRPRRAVSDVFREGCDQMLHGARTDPRSVVIQGTVQLADIRKWPSPPRTGREEPEYGWGME